MKEHLCRCNATPTVTRDEQPMVEENVEDGNHPPRAASTLRVQIDRGLLVPIETVVGGPVDRQEDRGRESSPAVTVAENVIPLPVRHPMVRNLYSLKGSYDPS